MTSLLGRTDGRSDPTPRPAFAVGDAGKNAVWYQLRFKSPLSHNFTQLYTFKIDVTAKVEFEASGYDMRPSHSDDMEAL